MLVSAFRPSSRAETITIPEGPSNYYAYELRVLGAGRVSGSFENADRRDVSVFVFSSSEYTWYAFIGAGTPIFHIRDAVGTFDVSLPASGTYYLVFAHPTWDDAATQVVRLRFAFEGIKSAPFVAGAILLVPGISLLVLGRRARSWQRKRAAVPTSG